MQNLRLPKGRPFPPRGRQIACAHHASLLAWVLAVEQMAGLQSSSDPCDSLAIVTRYHRRLLLPRVRALRLQKSTIERQLDKQVLHYWDGSLTHAEWEEAFFGCFDPFLLEPTRYPNVAWLQAPPSSERGN